jgi:hypothetical protein
VPREHPKVIVDPFFRRMEEIFTHADVRRLAETVDVVWGRDEPMDVDEFRGELQDAFAVVTGGWRYGNVLDEAPRLRAILTVSGGCRVRRRRRRDGARARPRVQPRHRRRRPRDEIR